MKYAQIRKFDTANGPGIRTTLFVSGCTHACPSCFNAEAQDFKYGDEWTKEIEDKFIEYVKNDNISGVSILGGEPLQQIKDNDMLNLLSRIKRETGKSIWMWTGYTLEEIINLDNKMQKDILEHVDVLIDGRFEIDKKDLTLKYRGSSNQRVINVNESLKQDKIVLL